MIGMSKRHLAGLSTSQTRDLHSGYVYQSDFIQSIAPDYRKRAMRVLTAKICLAVRMDSAQEDPEGRTGKLFREEIEKKLEKWQAPPPAPEVKPLVITVDGPKKRRGGKRYRKQKEKFAVTELQKQQNRLQFGVAEEEVLVFDETEGLGMLNQNTGLGRIRAAAADPRVKSKFTKFDNFELHLQ
jgi:U4/U6 small nuclear ribonucleoprotein PRP31